MWVRDKTNRVSSIWLSVVTEPGASAFKGIISPPSNAKATGWLLLPGALQYGVWLSEAQQCFEIWRVVPFDLKQETSLR